MAEQPPIQQTFDLALQHHRSAKYREAAHLYGQVLAQQPTHSGALRNLAAIAHHFYQNDLAVDLIRRAVPLTPNDPEIHNQLGIALKHTGHLDDAIASYQRAITLDPNLAQPHNNLGLALQEKGQLVDAIAAFRQAIALTPDYAEAHSNLALALLLRGDFEQGWLEYEWRWKVHGFQSPDRGFSQPQWDGSDLTGRTILLCAEQGFGDTLQFIRYLPLVLQRGGRVCLRVQPELLRLLQQLPGVDHWLTPNDPLPAFDVHCPFLSLPRLFATNLKNIPTQKAPLLPDPKLAQAWYKRLDKKSPGPKIGLAWTGNQGIPSHRNRSIAFSHLAPLASTSGVQFFSLQKKSPAKQKSKPPPGMPIIDWSDDLHDFADTAALISHMDLIISIDTSVAHLAAAMAKPVWLLLPFIPTWRWLRDRTDSPWYPTMRLFRQPSPGDWDSVIAQVAQELPRWINDSTHLHC